MARWRRSPGGRDGRAEGRSRLLALTVLGAALAGGVFVLVPRPDAVAAAGTLTAAPRSERLEGLGRVIDGDTLDVGAVRVRLHGVDAFERGQTCDLPDGGWACGAAATNALKAQAEGRRLSCEVLDTDRYGRQVSRCRRDGVDVARGLVDDGLALAYRRYSADYIAAEEAARGRRAGAWAGSFDRPEQWRRRGRRD